MLRKIKLYGLAGHTFGPSFELDVSSIAEATRALSVQIKGFREFVEQHNFRIVYGKTRKTGWQMSEEHCSFKLPAGDIHVVPVLRGAKAGGIGKIIAGVVLLAAAFFIPILPSTVLGGYGAMFGASTVGGFQFIGSFAAAGLGLVATGVSNLLAHAPKPVDTTDDSSFTIDGKLNITEQGGAVPLVYGLTLVGSTLISAGITTSEYTVASTASSGTTPDGVKATGWVSFTAPPLDGDALNLNGYLMTFVTGKPAYRGQVQIAATIAGTIDTLIEAMFEASDRRLGEITFVRSGNSLMLTFKTPGAIGNSFGMAENSVVMSLSGPSLAGGVA